MPLSLPNQLGSLFNFKLKLLGWSSRVLDTVEERAFVLDTFVLSKIVFKAQIIITSVRWVKKCEREICDFF